MSNTLDEIESMLQDCVEADEQLTDWERGFLASIDAQLAAARGPGQLLTAAQEEKLHAIWNRVTP